MKLVEILARELAEWPKPAAKAAQCGQLVRFYDGDLGVAHSLACTEATDQDSAIVTREMWEAERVKLAANESNGPFAVISIDREYSSEPDWSKAPDEATHWGPAVGGYCEAWVKSDMVGWLCLPTSGGAGWIRERRLISDLVERPISEYQRLWNGEGLPPVGTVCEVYHCDQWLQGEVIAHFQLRAGMVAAYTVEVGSVGSGIKHLDCAIGECFRPIRTSEQIAAEERENAVDEMVSVWRIALGRHSSECYEMAAALHAAGYRRE